MAYLLSSVQKYKDHVAELLTSSAEQRLARVLLRLAHLDKRGPAVAEIPVLSHQVLAEMVGTTRPRVNLFMNRFRKQGFIDYDGGLEVHQSLRKVLAAPLGENSRHRSRELAPNIATAVVVVIHTGVSTRRINLRNTSQLFTTEHQGSGMRSLNVPSSSRASVLFRCFLVSRRHLGKALLSMCNYFSTRPGLGEGWPSFDGKKPSSRRAIPQECHVHSRGWRKAYGGQ